MSACDPIRHVEVHDNVLRVCVLQALHVHDDLLRVLDVLHHLVVHGDVLCVHVCCALRVGLVRLLLLALRILARRNARPPEIMTDVFTVRLGRKSKGSRGEVTVAP